MKKQKRFRTNDFWVYVHLNIRNKNNEKKKPCKRTAFVFLCAASFSLRLLQLFLQGIQSPRNGKGKRDTSRYNTRELCRVHPTESQRPRKKENVKKDEEPEEN